MRTTNPIVILCLLVLCIPAASAKFYKWVDAEGNVYYSDKIPPNHAEHAREEMSTQGVTVKETPRAQTQEEFDKELELERLRVEQKRLIEKQRETDRVLLRTFRSEDDIILAQDGKLASIDVMIQLTQSSIRRLQSKLTQLQKRAASLERSGKKVPDKLLAHVNITLNNINKGYTTIEYKEQNKQNIRDVFNRDLKRFLALKNIQFTAPIRSKQSYYELNNLLHCSDDAACDAAWVHAEEFVKIHATTRLQMLSERIIMTAAPANDQDVSITISRIVNRDTGKTVLFMDLYCKDSPLGRAHCASAKIKGVREAYKPRVGKK